MRKRDEKRPSSSAAIEGESPPQKRTEIDMGTEKTTSMGVIPVFPISGKSLLDNMFDTQGDDAEREMRDAEEKDKGTSQASSAFEVNSAQLAQMLVGMKTAIEAQQAQIVSMQQQNATAAQHLGDSNTVIQRLTELLQGNLRGPQKAEEEPTRATSGDHMLEEEIQEAFHEADKEKRLKLRESPLEQSRRPPKERSLGTKQVQGPP